MPGRTYTIPCQTSSGHTIYHAMPTRLYHIRCHISPGHTILYVMVDRPYHVIPYQTITFTTPYLVRPIHIPCDALQAIPFTMPCQPDHTIYHAIPARPYHIPCHARQAIPKICHPARSHHTSIPSHTSPGNTIYHAKPART